MLAELALLGEDSTVSDRAFLPLPLLLVGAVVGPSLSPQTRRAAGVAPATFALPRTLVPRAVVVFGVTQSGTVRLKYTRGRGQRNCSANATA